jgi:NADP-dependent aldehyde dehydrogenase
MELKGVSLIGSGEGKARNGFSAVNPATGVSLEPHYSYAEVDEIDAAVRLAAEAFPVYSKISGAQKATFLRQIATGLESNIAALVDRAQLETALPVPRLKSEVWRTSNQLQMFADVVEEGSWVGARIDSPDPARKPLPKPDVRSMLLPLGPVVVFGASNFPFAFSVAGGDTASALAAGNPVVAKAHLAHPGTGELVGRIVQESVRACGLPQGVFSLLYGAGEGIGIQLVEHPLIKAVGFTGSHAGGKALMRLAAAREVPIPCYAEMGSVNPVFILPKVFKQKSKEIATGLYGSFTLGAGQFCTKPGLVFLPKVEETKVFRSELTQLVQDSPQQVLLTAGISDKYSRAVHDRRTDKTTRLLANSKPAEKHGSSVSVMLFATESETFQQEKSLEEEVFGPSTLLIEYQDYSELLKIASNLEGHLTATLHGTEDELIACQDLVKILETKVGRLLFNGFPTGVEVCHAMVHGGPYPATSDGRSTSVGSQAIFRFVRPVCYQNFPDSMLPDELKSNNPLNILRMVDGVMKK